MKLATVRDPVEAGEPPFEVGLPAAERAVALLDAILSFKLENRPLLRPREVAPTGVWKSAPYLWTAATVSRNETAAFLVAAQA